MTLTSGEIKDRIHELVDNHMATGGCAARGMFGDPCFICRAAITMVLDGKLVEPDIEAVPLNLEEQRAIHTADCMEVKSRPTCGYECSDCGLCTKLAHTKHKAAPCPCRPLDPSPAKGETLQGYTNG